MARFNASLLPLVVSLLCCSMAHAMNNAYPIVLVHGIMGWGRDELFGVKYWGGIHGDYEQRLRDQGFTVFTATIGPVSSNWDRACELFAQIKGGTVHYGTNHSAHHGHNATGRTFQGLYPQWGEVVNGEIQKVHLIGHSMGGQTSRMLAQLLNKGTQGAPIQEDPKSHLLFEGGHDWVHSVTTIATPNQGTLLADGIGQIGNVVKDAFFGAFAVLGLAGTAPAKVFDFKMDHWGVAPKAKDEGFKEYALRILQHDIFKPGFEDVCLYSLTTAGAKAENQWVTTLPNVFYFSFSTADTFNAVNMRLEPIQLPRVFSMFLPLQPTAAFIGSRYGPKRGFQETWQPNDGAVPLISQNYDGNGQVITFDAMAQPGRWHHMAVLNHVDHMAAIGVKLARDIFSVYSSHVGLLWDLPTSQLISRRLELGIVDHTAPEELVSNLQQAAVEVSAPQDLQELQTYCAQAASEDNLLAQRLCVASNVTSSE